MTQIISSLLLNNVTFNVGRVHRSKLDMLFAVNRPKVPTQNVTIWGGVTEKKYIYDDPAYISKFNAYSSAIYSKQRKLFESVISYNKEDALSKCDKELYALTANILLTLLTDTQLYLLYDEVMYNSTVTSRGLQLAYNMLGVTKHDKDIRNIKLPDSSVRFSQLYRDMTVAREQGYTWHEFCALTGQEQSTLVAYNNLKHTLTYLERQENE